MFTSLKIQLMKFMIHTFGYSSKGICMCHRYGMTSGEVLDYVYQNQPKGSFSIGKAIDKAFLSHPGWEGVRQRRTNLEQLMIESIQEKEGTPFIVDIASGPGSYILSVLKKYRGTALCRDLDARNLKIGIRNAERNNLLSRVHFAKGDAFDLRLAQTPDIIVSSGFYDWIYDDEEVMRSFGQIHRALSLGGTFLLTVQCRHPNQRVVEAVFKDFNKQSLKMKMRAPETVSLWLKNSGFSLEKTLTDEERFYCVMKAKKEAV